MSQELKKLEAKLKYLSAAQLAVELGYRSPNTIVAWFKNKKIPPTALLRVKNYLDKKQSH